MKWLDHIVAGIQRMEALPLFFFVFLGAVLPEGPVRHLQSCLLYEFGFFEKAWYSDKRDSNVPFRVAALCLCYLDLKPILGPRFTSLGQQARG